MSTGQKRITRWLLHDVTQGISKDEFFFLFPKKFKKERIEWLIKTKMTPWIPNWLRPFLKKSFRRYRNHRRGSRIRFLKNLRAAVENICFPPMNTGWSDYYKRWLPFSPSQEWTAKQHSVFQVLKSLQPTSVLDIGSNRGWYSQLAARCGSSVVALDSDETCIELLYRDAKNHNLSILPLVIDIRQPSAGYGLRNKMYKPATERLNSEMVLALALVHHLVKQTMDFQQITEALSIFTKKWLLVEFVSCDDRYVREWWSERFSWYSLENFIRSLRKHFSIVESLPTGLESRVLLLCSKHPDSAR